MLKTLSACFASSRLWVIMITVCLYLWLETFSSSMISFPMDGIQALKEIRKIDGSAKVIMCSAMGQQAMVIESIQAGAKDFIVKPFAPERVLEAVKKVVG